MFSNPKKVVDALGVTSGMTIADVGSGSGEYTIALAKAVGHDGRVYAIDVQKDLLARTKEAAAQAGVGIVEIVWGDVEKKGGAGLSDNAVDVSVVANLLFQLEDKKAAIEEVARITRPTGKVAVVDWQDSFGGLGPQPDAVVSAEDVIALFKEQGFKETSRFDAGDHHYGLILQKDL